MKAKEDFMGYLARLFKLVTLTLLMNVSSLPSIYGIHKIEIEVDLQSPGTHISPTMWGIFFEDINFGADGGLYAELVKNRGFELPEPMLGWHKIATSLGQGILEIKNESPFDPENPNYLRIRSNGYGVFGVWNEGFRGMGFKAGESYKISFYARKVADDIAVRIELVGENGTTLATGLIEIGDTRWQRYELKLTSSGTDPKGKLYIYLERPGIVDIDFVSVFPCSTWKGKPLAYRIDLVQLLSDLKPGFLRFPGGCIVEGSHLDRRYQWKNTILPITKRKPLINRWNYEFKHRPTPDYYQSFGLGFYEFFILAEELGAEPLPVINCGMACQFNSGELCPIEELDSYIQDALDLIEFANGPVTSKWGAVRATLGHPQPFNLKYLGIGNEQWGPQYIERYERFANVIKAKYPEIQLIAAAGPSPGDERFHYLWRELRRLKADIIDEHCYAKPIWFLTQFHRYDKYDRNGPKVFMGEFAAQSEHIASPQNRNTIECALAEAVYMLGMERNADIVIMASYAPLFGHIDAWQWSPNLIWFDNIKVLPTPNYYVQQLFSLNRGDRVLKVKCNSPTKEIPLTGGIGVGTFNTAAEFKDIRVELPDKTLKIIPSSADDLAEIRNRGWEFEGGIYRQNYPNGNRHLLLGESSWSSYSLTLKARKLDGQEGFAIYLYRDETNDAFILWNIGGGNNSRHVLISRFGGQEEFLASCPGKIEKGKWYEIQLKLQSHILQCYLDGNLIHEVHLPLRLIYELYCSATLDEKTHEAIIKIVNPHPKQYNVEVKLNGASAINGWATLITLTGPGPTAMNTFEQPNLIMPQLHHILLTEPSLNLQIMPYSMVVTRIPVK